MKVNIINKNLKYEYKFETKKSGIVGVYGISGSGKSSLLDALAGYDNEREGLVEHNGKKLTGVVKCAYMNQHPVLFQHWTIKENLEFAKSYSSNSYSKLVNQLNCSDLLNKYPEQLSGGEKQRITLIRTLIQINDNTLVLLDEPFTALDSTLKKTALNLLSQYRNCLIFFVTHDISEIYRIADSFLYLRNNTISYKNDINQAMASGYENLPIASRIVIEGHVLVVYADDVSISLNKNSESSIYYQLETTIEEIGIKSNYAILELSYLSGVDVHSIYAKLTKKSVGSLNLKKKQKVIACFKSVATT